MVVIGLMQLRRWSQSDKKNEEEKEKDNHFATKNVRASPGFPARGPESFDDACRSVSVIGDSRSWSSHFGHPVRPIDYRESCSRQRDDYSSHGRDCCGHNKGAAQ